MSPQKTCNNRIATKVANKLPKNLSGTFHEDPLREDDSPLPPSGFNENMPEVDGSFVQGGRLLSDKVGPRMQGTG